MVRRIALIALFLLTAGLGGAVGGPIAGVMMGGYRNALDEAAVGTFFGFILGSWAGLILLFFRPSARLLLVALVNFIGGFVAGAGFWLFVGSLAKIGIR